MFGAATERATGPRGKGRRGQGPQEQEGEGSRGQRAVTTISPRSSLSHASKPINSPSRISTGINTIRSWGKQEHEVAALK